MSIDYKKIIGSTPFHFILGPDQKRFAIHAALAAHHSAPLGVLTGGPMCEAQDGVANLDDVTEGTFVRFCEYAYTGDYTPEHEPMLDSSIIGRETSLPKDNGEAAFGQFYIKEVVKKEKNKRASHLFAEEKCCGCGRSIRDASRKRDLCDEFRRRHYSISTPCFKPRGNVEECEDYTDVFLCHAQVYVFADKYDVASLRTLALHKLHQALMRVGFDIQGKQIRDIANLVQYGYSNNNTRDNEVGQDIDSLRKLLVHYVACVFEIVATDDSFLELMEEGGLFVRDLMGMLLKRIK